MNEKTALSSPQKNNVISSFILVLMLTIRILDHYLPDAIFSQETPAWFSNYFIDFSLYSLTFLLLWLNKNDLKAYNIDKLSYNLLLAGGIVLIVTAPDGLPAIILLMIVLFFYWANFKNFIYTKENTKYPWWTVPIFMIFIGLAWLPVLQYSLYIKSALDGNALVYAFFQANLPGVIIEEFLFRGFLWGYLRNRGMDEWGILLIQAILFWISHHRYLPGQNTYGFWIPIPFAALLLGYLVLKSKSLASSTVAHFLFNFTTSIIRRIYF